MVLRQENSAMSKSCKHQNDFIYDDCAYSENNKLLRETLNCSLFGNIRSSNDRQQMAKECTLLDVSQSGQEAFRDIVYGKANIFVPINIIDIFD